MEIHPKQWKRPISEVWPQVAFVCRTGEIPPISKKLIKPDVYPQLAIYAKVYIATIHVTKSKTICLYNIKSKKNLYKPNNL